MLSSQILFDNFADLALKAPYQRAPTTLQIIHCIESSMLYFLGRKVNVKSLRKSRQQQRRSSSSSKTKSKKKKFSLQKVFVAKVLFESGGLPRGQLCNNLDNLRSDSDSSGGKSLNEIGKWLWLSW